MGTIKSFKDLEIWKKGISLVKIVYKTTKCFPADETYGLTAQIRRCAVSVPSNVAEGFRRQHSKEFRQFLSIALGSLAELETQLIIAIELGYTTIENNKDMFELIDHISRMIVVLSRRL